MLQYLVPGPLQEIKFCFQRHCKKNLQIQKKLALRLYEIIYKERMMQDT